MKSLVLLLWIVLVAILLQSVVATATNFPPQFNIPANIQQRYASSFRCSDYLFEPVAPTSHSSLFNTTLTPATNSSRINRLIDQSSAIHSAILERVRWRCNYAEYSLMKLSGAYSAIAVNATLYPEFAQLRQQFENDGACAVSFVDYVICGVRLSPHAIHSAIYNTTEDSQEDAQEDVIPEMNLPLGNATCDVPSVIYQNCNPNDFLSLMSQRQVGSNTTLYNASLIQRPSNTLCPVQPLSSLQLSSNFYKSRILALTHALPYAELAVRCIPHGRWSSKSNSCQCYGGWSGMNCSTPLPCLTDPVVGSVCNGNGICTSTGQCKCNNNYYGTLCSTSIQYDDESESNCSSIKLDLTRNQIRARCSFDIASIIRDDTYLMFWSSNATIPYLSCSTERLCLESIVEYITCSTFRAKIFGMNAVLPRMLSITRNVHNRLIDLNRVCTKYYSYKASNCSSGISNRHFGIGNEHTTCSCPFPYTGEYCDIIRVEGCANSCSGHGTCEHRWDRSSNCSLEQNENNGNQFVCVCENGYSGEICDIRNENFHNLTWNALSGIALTHLHPERRDDVQIMMCNETELARELLFSCNILSSDIAVTSMEVMSTECAYSYISYVSCKLKSYYSHFVFPLQRNYDNQNISATTVRSSIIWPTSKIIQSLRVARQTLLGLSSNNVSETNAIQYERCELETKHVSDRCGNLDVTSPMLTTSPSVCRLPGCSEALLNYLQCYIQLKRSTTPTTLSTSLWNFYKTCSFNESQPHPIFYNSSNITFHPVPELTEPTYSPSCVAITSPLSTISTNDIFQIHTVMRNPNFTTLAMHVKANCSFDPLLDVIPFYSTFSNECLSVSPSCALSYWALIATAQNDTSDDPIVQKLHALSRSSHFVQMLRCVRNSLILHICPPPPLPKINCSASCNNVAAMSILQHCGFDVRIPLNHSVFTMDYRRLPSRECAWAIYNMSNCRFDELQLNPTCFAPQLMTNGSYLMRSPLFQNFIALLRIARDYLQYRGTICTSQCNLQLSFRNGNYSEQYCDDARLGLVDRPIVNSDCDFNPRLTYRDYDTRGMMLNFITQCPRLFTRIWSVVDFCNSTASITQNIGFPYSSLPVIIQPVEGYFGISVELTVRGTNIPPSLALNAAAICRFGSSGFLTVATVGAEAGNLRSIKCYTPTWLPTGKYEVQISIDNGLNFLPQSRNSRERAYSLFTVLPAAMNNQSLLYPVVERIIAGVGDSSYPTNSECYAMTKSSNMLEGTVLTLTWYNPGELNTMADIKLMAIISTSQTGKVVNPVLDISIATIAINLPASSGHFEWTVPDLSPFLISKGLSSLTLIHLYLSLHYHPSYLPTHYSALTIFPRNPDSNPDGSNCIAKLGGCNGYHECNCLSSTQFFWNCVMGTSECPCNCDPGSAIAVSRTTPSGETQHGCIPKCMPLDDNPDCDDHCTRYPMDCCREAQGSDPCCAPNTDCCDPFGYPVPDCPDNRDSGGGNGDPHFTTFDRMPFDFNDIGTFWIVQTFNSSTTPKQMEFSAQIYILPNGVPETQWSTYSGVAWTHALSARNSETQSVVVIVATFVSIDVYIDGIKLKFPPPSRLASSYMRFDGGEIFLLSQNSIKLIFDSGFIIKADGGFSNLFTNFMVDIPRKFLYRTFGLMGSYDRNSSNDFIGRNGHNYALTMSTARAAIASSRTWAVSRDESYFMILKNPLNMSCLLGNTNGTSFVNSSTPCEIMQYTNLVNFPYVNTSYEFQNRRLLQTQSPDIQVIEIPQDWGNNTLRTIAEARCSIINSTVMTFGNEYSESEKREYVASFYNSCLMDAYFMNNTDATNYMSVAAEATALQSTITLPILDVTSISESSAEINLNISTTVCTSLSLNDPIPSTIGENAKICVPKLEFQGEKNGGWFSLNLTFVLTISNSTLYTVPLLSLAPSTVYSVRARTSIFTRYQIWTTSYVQQSFTTLGCAPSCIRVLPSSPVEVGSPCGSDGCGGSCGSCAFNEECLNALFVQQNVAANLSIFSIQSISTSARISRSDGGPFVCVRQNSSAASSSSSSSSSSGVSSSSSSSSSPIISSSSSLLVEDRSSSSSLPAIISSSSSLLEDRSSSSSSLLAEYSSSSSSPPISSSSSSSSSTSSDVTSSSSSSLLVEDSSSSSSSSPIISSSSSLLIEDNTSSSSSSDILSSSSSSSSSSSFSTSTIIPYLTSSSQCDDHTCLYTSHETSANGLSTSEIIGVVVGVSVGVILIVLFIVYICRKRNKTTKPTQISVEMTRPTTPV
jgi:hypothetical protein